MTTTAQRRCCWTGDGKELLSSYQDGTGRDGLTSDSFSLDGFDSAGRLFLIKKGERVDTISLIADE